MSCLREALFTSLLCFKQIIWNDANVTFCTWMATISSFVCYFQSAAAQSLVQLLSDAVDEEVMSQFVQTFLLESNSTAVRWQAHELLYSMHKYVYLS